MFRITKLSFASLLLASVFCVSSCKKNKDDEVDNDPSAATDNALAEQSSNDIVEIAGQASEFGVNGSYRVSGDAAVLLTGCANVTVDTNTKIITVAYNGGVCVDGRTRNGTLYFNYSGSASGAKWYRDPGFSCVVTSNGYSVNGNQITINNKTITNITPSDFPSGAHTPVNTTEKWHITSNISITKASGGTFTWICDRTKELLNTNDPNVYRGTAQAIYWPKAKIGITGSASGTTASGNAYTINVTSQLVRDFNACGMGSRFTQGVLVFTPSGKNARTVDYSYGPNGSGLCDDWVKITIKGWVFYKEI